MGRITQISVVRFALAFSLLGGLAACAKQGEKTFQPVVAKIGTDVRAISSEEAKTVCQNHYCEDNQIYVTHFGRSRPTPTPTVAPPAPVPAPTAAPKPPTQPPTNLPPQPAETASYSREMMGLPAAWKITEGSASTIVAVIDSGVDYYHPDLRDNIAVNNTILDGYPGDQYGWDFYHDRANGFDDNGHGTHCAGIIAGAKNGIGVIGVAPKVKILPVKFLGPTGSGDTADAVKAIDYAVARGAKVISNSWGGGGFSRLLDDAIQRAVNKGVIIVAAAGNDGTDNDQSPHYPAGYANVISVGSNDQKDAKSSFSNYGEKSVMVFAPGSSIYSTYPNGQYKVLSGTSMATPQISGAIALAVSLKKGVTRAAIVEDLCDSAVQRMLNVSKCGRVDVAQFVKRISTR